MRQLLYTGFNVFGQHSINSSDADCAAASCDFEEITGPENTGYIIALSWRYTAYARENKIWMRGLLNEAPNESLEVDTPHPVKALAACDSHCLVLLNTGELYKLLPKLAATLQHIRLEAAPKPNTAIKRTLFGIAKVESANFISHIACGSHINVAISSSNLVFSIPSCLHQFPERQWRVKQLLCGHEHALLLNGNGDVYTWGNGLRGQLGQSTLSVEETPLLLEALAGIKIIHIAAGGWHSAAISAFGDLYTWGLNCNGQLGMRVMKPDGLLKEPTVYPLPQLLDLPATDCCCGTETDDETDTCAPVRVFAGSRHTLLLRRCGRLWATGWCAHGQLGRQLAKQPYVDSFQTITDIRLSNDCDILCGPWATMLVLCK